MIKKLNILLLLLGFASALHAEIIVNSTRGTIRCTKSQAYQWYFNGKLIPGALNQEILVIQEGNYKVEAVDSLGNKHTENISIGVLAGTVRKIFIIGDSTASDYDASVYPQTGWAQVFQNFFNSDNIQIVNRAYPGSSSMSFYNSDEWGWSTVLSQMHKGDFLFIQFAHNDEKIDKPNLYTEPFTTYKNYLGNYIRESRAKGVIPVLLTPVNRNTWNADTITISNSHGNYPTAMKELATSTKTPILDIGAKSKSLFEKFGKYATTWNIFLYTRPGEYVNYPSGNKDNSHFSQLGAPEIAKLVADAIWESSADSIKKLLKPHLVLNTAMNTIKYTINKEKTGYILGPTRVPQKVKCQVTASPASNYSFVNWTVNGSPFSVNAQITINGNSTYNLVANFQKKVLSTFTDTVSLKEDVSLIFMHNEELIKVESSEKLEEVSLFNMEGKILLMLKPMNNEVFFKTSGLNHGIYIVKCKSKKKINVKKIAL